MRIWIDLANSPHVPFFRALAKEFIARGHECQFTARDFAETVPLAIAAELDPEIIGRHGGKQLSGKAGSLLERALSLRRWARGRSFDFALSHNSYSQILASKLLRLPAITLMDYEHQPANHLAFRFSSKIIVPESFPDAALRRFGARQKKIRRYQGIKEDVYLADFEPDPEFAAGLSEFAISPDNVLVVVRPPARAALYHRFENELFDQLLAKLLEMPEVRIVLLPRDTEQRAIYTARSDQHLIVPPGPVEGLNLIAACDLVISAGGTMNREAAALGVPAASVYAGAWAALDESLVKQGRLERIASIEDFNRISIVKKAGREPRRAVAVKEEVVNLILD